MMSTLTSAGLARGGAPRALDGRVALITGSTEGRGLAIAAGLAARGAMIALAGPGDPAAIRSLCQSLGTDFDVPVWHDDADMSDAAALADMVERIQRGLGAVDILVSQGDQRLGDPAAEPMRDLAVYFHATAAVLPGMQRRGFGRIINVAPAIDPSVTDIDARHRVIHDILTHLTEATSRRLSSHGITCHALLQVRDSTAAGPPPLPLVATDAPHLPPLALVSLVAGLCGEEVASVPGLHWTAVGIDGPSDHS